MGDGKDGLQSQWYREMHHRIHQQPDTDVGYIQVQYTRKTRFPYDGIAGYTSEPEQDFQARGTRALAHDFSSVRPEKSEANEPVKYTLPVYRNAPGKIENYLPGKSSVATRKSFVEAEDPMADPTQALLSTDWENYIESSKPRRPFEKQNMAYILAKDAGYDSDSTLVFRKRDPQHASPESVEPARQKEWYKEVQKGGEIPVTGLRKPAPERPKGPVQKYQESEVNIHYRTPVRLEEKTWIPEQQLRMQQEAALRKRYQEERRKKYLQELQDSEMRRHQDYMSPLQKSLIPGNRYDGLEATRPPPVIIQRPRWSEDKRITARALYDFHAQNAKELSFMKGDLIYVGRRIDKNWYEGERHASRGIFPVSYVELMNGPWMNNPGQAMAKYAFVPQLPNEIGFSKGDIVTLLRRVDHNWWEGRIGSRQGIFPAAYVEVIVEPEFNVLTSPSRKPVASPASHSLIMNKQTSMMMNDVPRFDASPSMASTTSASAGPPQRSLAAAASPVSASAPDARASLVRSKIGVPIAQAEPVQYQALYPYHPVNDDELELREGDLVEVFEKCDDGWYVGTSLRTGLFGTFPGNYVHIV